MTEYGDKKAAVDAVQRGIENELGSRDLHPTDEAEVLREIQSHAGARAFEQEEANDRDGVPERPEDIQESAVSGRLDG